MATRLFSFIVEGDVFHGVAMDEAHPVGIRWSSALLSSPGFVDATAFPDVSAGCTWDGTYFYSPEAPFGAPLEAQPIEDAKIVKFAGVVGQEVFGLITLYPADFTDDHLELMRIAMSMSPIIIETTDNPMVGVGWTYDGTTFFPPVGA
ncbi:hypothetical protein UFOVP965_125 [uncultured Caudovirales phage]|uniref:Uncharacterized protein n=1 Tax=uncultured Caudovirales phage TaxID=2100421 RepID=A0A6J5PTE7_9CAUD|nr:hypothetical protein UFOVP965_125 [uncultured Caudovirales phage]CAB4179914.1 hypothetical protein UFOVP1035_121 [uncultured Caudovirales phage]CAB4188750.1 hypothetical protein UFOVP1181_80 [uncultured Caudovirales phage]